MTLVVYAEASEGTYPGHMVVGQESNTSNANYYGFRFDPADLPAEYRPISKWRNYLSSNAVRGKIVNESSYIEYVLGNGTREFFEKRTESQIAVESCLPATEELEPHAWYSFNPDNAFPGKQPCYNCVKWAIMIANSVADGFLTPVFQGRIKSVLSQLTRVAIASSGEGE